MIMTVFALRSVRHVFARRAFTILRLILVSTVLLGCQPLIEVVQPPTPPVSPVATVTPDERGVAIMGVDFDPPLDAGQLLQTGGVTLLVAVENQGQVVEPSVRVNARLFDPAAAGKVVDLANETVTIRGLEPGELRVVRFTQVTELPVRSRYKLVVEVTPVPGEAERQDNVKTYDIIVRSQE